MGKIKRPIKKTTWTFRSYLELACNVGVYVFLFFFMVIYAFYAPEGYIKIATNKYLFFRKMSQLTVSIMIPLIFLYYAEAPGGTGKTWYEKCRGFIGKLSATDMFVLEFVLIHIISYCLTDYRDEAIWGTSGWNMGFVTHLIFVVIYYLMSRFYDNRIALLPYFMAVTGIIFGWGILNRFSVYPVDMHYDSTSFLSSMGNINWLCGYWSVFFSIGIVLYIISEEKKLRILSAIHVAVSLGLGVIEGSDSAFLSMLVIFFFLFMVSFRKTDYMERLLEVGIIFCAACQVMRLVTVIFPESLNMHYFLMDFMLGNLTLAALCVLILLRYLIGRYSGKYNENRSLGSSGQEWIWKLKWLRNVVAGAAAVTVIAYLVLLIVNTKNPGSIGALSRYPAVFQFNFEWGSNRGGTWMVAIDIYKLMSPVQKIFGVGQDCFAAFAYGIPDMTARLEAEWGSLRLTNAHNECLTYLVNIGILGVASFISIFVSSFIRLVKKAEKEPLCYVFAASILSYFFHNQFSFSQIENIPFIFMMLGLGENLLRQNSDKK